MLSSNAILSTDEESSGDDGSDIEDIGKDLESMLSNKKMSAEVCNMISEMNYSCLSGGIFIQAASQIFESSV